MMRGTRRRVELCLPLVAVLLLFVAGSIQPLVYGQVFYGSLVGTVTDQTGAVVPGATVTATETQTHFSRKEVTDEGGRYNITNLLPGNYALTVMANGFRTIDRTGIVLTPNTVTRNDFHLEVGSTTEQVNVTADATELQTDKADTHTEISSAAVVNLPLGGDRSYQTLINLTPGAMPGNFYNSVTDTPNRPLNTHINGGAGQTNITRIDGAESLNVWLPQYSGYVPPAETVSMVNVTTSAASADQGLAGSSAILVVTKSGTNDIHGSAFEFHNDQDLNARNFFLVGTKPVGIYNNYGGTVGGPIKKDKLFYFVSFDGTNQKTAANGLYTVPTADQRAGNFSAYGTTIYNPLTGNADGTGRLPFAGNIVPSSLFAPQALALQNYYPAPNLPGVVNNYEATGGPILNRYYTDAKGNWNRNEKHTIWFKYGRMDATSGGQGIFGVAGGPSPDSDPGQGDTHSLFATIGHTYVLAPNLILDGSLGYSRWKQDVEGDDYGKNYGATLGIPGLNGTDIRDSGFPDVTIGAYTGFGVPNWMPLFRTDETYTHSDSLTWTKGAHEFRFGFDLVRHHLNHWQPELSNGGPRGLLDFNGQMTVLNGPDAAVPNQYNAYAQFLLGYSDNVQKGLQYIEMTGREWQLAGFAQDRWQVTQKLTVTLGLRYEFYPLMTRSDNKGIERYDPANNDVYLGGRGDVPEDVGITVSHKLFAPRLGVAYRLDNKTVVRAGYGMNFDPLDLSRPLRGFYPLTVNFNFVAPNSYSYASTLALGIPPVVGPDLSTGIVPLPGDASERSPWGGELHRGYIQSWNFTIERKLPEDIVASVGYVAQHSTHLMGDYNINVGTPGAGTAGLPYNTAAFDYRELPTDMYDGYLNSSYNSLQVAFNRSFSGGLMLKGAYTWSHAIDQVDDDGWAGVDNNFDGSGWDWAPVFGRNRATAGFNQTQVFQLGWVYQLPIGTGKKYLANGVIAKVVGGWQFSGIESCYTGTPFTITAPDTNLNDAGMNEQTANQIAPVQFLGHIGPGAYYYSPTSFAAPTAAATFGTSGRNILNYPGVWNTDMSIMRQFPIKERLNLQFRTEFYNLPNTSHFGVTGSNPVDGGVTDQAFMQVTSSSGERNIRFGLRLQW
jgi:outer membrane receptor protein involved in Fe transport